MDCWKLFNIVPVRLFTLLSLEHLECTGSLKRDDMLLKSLGLLIFQVGVCASKVVQRCFSFWMNFSSKAQQLIYKQILKPQICLVVRLLFNRLEDCKYCLSIFELLTFIINIGGAFDRRGLPNPSPKRQSNYNASIYHIYNNSKQKSIEGDRMENISVG